MRSDLNKQLCERERIGHRRKFSAVRHKKRFNPSDEMAEDVRDREGMRWRYKTTYTNKEFNENLNPLWGAVRKAVGTPWNDFYSELCKNFDKRSTINQHILDHLFQRVKVNGITIKEDGLIYVTQSYFGTVLLKDSTIEYYVDPRDGILKHNDSNKTYRQTLRDRAEKLRIEEEKVFRRVSQTEVLRKIADIWFLFEMRPIPTGWYEYTKPEGRDVFRLPFPYARDKTWDQMSYYERSRVGNAKFIGECARDIYTDQRVYRDLSGSIYEMGHVGACHSRAYIDGMYHASKKTAPHKLLKKMAIV